MAEKMSRIQAKLQNREGCIDMSYSDQWQIENCSIDKSKFFDSKLFRSSSNSRFT